MFRVTKSYAVIIFLLLSLLTACIAPTISKDINPQHPYDNSSSSSSASGQLPTQAKPTQNSAEILPNYPLTVTDDLGRKVTINKQPQRIISLAPSNTETLFALGLDDRIVGVTDYCDYPEAAKTKPRVAGYSTPDLEKLVSLEPDLVVAESIQEKTVLPALENLKMTVFVTEAYTVDTILNDVSVLGKITGKSNEAASVVESMKAKIDSVVSRTENLTAAQRPRVMYANWNDPFWTMGSNNYIDDVITMAGGVNIYAKDFEKSRAVSLESVVVKNPQVIFVSGMGTTADTILNGIKQDPRLVTMDAVINNRVYKISDNNLIERPGPRIVDGLLEVAQMIHPEIFGAPK